jgi:hypothetical protein
LISDRNKEAICDALQQHKQTPIVGIAAQALDTCTLIEFSAGLEMNCEPAKQGETPSAVTAQQFHPDNPVDPLSESQ